MTKQLSNLQHYKEIFRLGVPIMIGQIGIISVSFADNIMVGRYSTDAIAAASFVNSMFNLPMLMIIGFSIGLTPIIARFFSQDDEKTVADHLKNGVFINVVFAALLTVIMSILYFFIDKMGQPVEILPLIKTYYLINLVSLIFVSFGNGIRQFFDGIGDVSVSMWIMLISNVVNILFNYLLIFGKFGFPELGLAGAGLSTLLSRVLLPILFLFAFKSLPRYKSYFEHLRNSVISKKSIKYIYSKSWPVSMQLGLETSFFSLSGIMMGWIGTIALASYQIMVVIGMLGFIIYNSYGASIAIKVSHYLGVNDIGNVRKVTMCGYQIMILFTVIACSIFYFFGEPIISLFTDDKAVIAAATTLILPLILYQVADSTQITFSNALRGVSYVKPLSFIALFSYIIIGVPSAYLIGFTMNGGAKGIFYSFSIGLFIAAILYYYFYNRKVKEQSR